MSEVIFRNYSKYQGWEISAPSMSMYIPYDLITDESQRDSLSIILSTFKFKDLDGIIDTLVKYTEDPQEDMFIVEEVNNDKQ